MKVLIEKTLEIDMPPEELCKAIMGSDNYELISIGDVMQVTSKGIGIGEASWDTSKHVVKIKLREKN